MALLFFSSGTQGRGEKRECPRPEQKIPVLDNI
jgi:hypothetical protein